MPTWSEIQEYARSKYKLASDDEDSFMLVFEYADDRLQAVIVSRFETIDREWCDFASACCKKDQMSPEVALEKNFQFPVGAIALDKDIYVVRYGMQMATMDLEAFDLPLHIVASIADKLEQEFASVDDF